MKKLTTILALLLFTFTFTFCESNLDEEILCGTYNGEQLYKGPRDGCYYKNSNGNKTYVDRSECDC